MRFHTEWPQLSPDAENPSKRLPYINWHSSSTLKRDTTNVWNVGCGLNRRAIGTVRKATCMCTSSGHPNLMYSRVSTASRALDQQIRLESDASVGALGGSLELQTEALWHGGGWRAGQAIVHLHRVVDEPLQGREGADHDDPREETLPHGCGQTRHGLYIYIWHRGVALKTCKKYYIM